MCLLQLLLSLHPIGKTKLPPYVRIPPCQKVVRTTYAYRLCDLNARNDHTGGELPLRQMCWAHAATTAAAFCCSSSSSVLRPRAHRLRHKNLRSQTGRCKGQRASTTYGPVLRANNRAQEGGNQCDKGRSKRLMCVSFAELLCGSQPARKPRTETPSGGGEEQRESDRTIPSSAVHTQPAPAT